MKTYEIRLRIPASPKGLELLEEAGARLPFESVFVCRQDDTLHVDALVQAADLQAAYAKAWKELAIKLATRRKPECDELDDWSEMLADHAMQLRRYVEQFCQLIPQFDDELDGCSVGQALRQVVLSAQEMLDSLGERREVAE